MKLEEYLRFVATNLIKDLEPSAEFAKLTRNSDLKGAHVEAAVRQIVANAVAPLRVCRGGIVDNELARKEETLLELDIIIWTPNPAPALFCVGDFGMVPRSSAVGVIEVKRSNYKQDVFSKIEERTSLAFQQKHLWPEPAANQAIGVVCLNDVNLGSPPKHLLDAGRLVVLFDQDGDRLTPRVDDVFRLVNFLARICRIPNRSKFHADLTIPGEVTCPVSSDHA